MIQVSAPLAPLIAFTPLATEHWLLLLASALLGVGAAWYLQSQKILALEKLKSDQATAQAKEIQSLKDSHGEIISSQKAQAKLQAANAQEKLGAAAASFAAIEDRYSTFKEVTQRREQDADERITKLSAELAAARELAAQLEPTKARILDLEAALSSERGRLSALEQTVVIANKRADDFERRVEQSYQDLQRLKQEAETREHQLKSEVSKLSETIRANANIVETAESQIAEATETLSSLKQQSETRITNLQRQLAAAEAKSALVQKEFMSAVGVLPEKPLPSLRSQPAVEDKRVSELEAKITQLEADSRKKAREDGYKIAELEYRLSEAQDKAP